MKKRWQHITNDGDCPNEQSLRLYLKKKLPGDQMFLVENHLAGCDMCRDFAEGMELMGESRMELASTEIKNRLHEKLKAGSAHDKPDWKRWLVAASIFMLVGTGLLFLFVFQPDSDSPLVYQPEPRPTYPELHAPVPVQKPLKEEVVENDVEEITEPAIPSSSLPELIEMEEEHFDDVLMYSFEMAEAEYDIDLSPENIEPEPVMAERAMRERQILARDQPRRVRGVVKEGDTGEAMAGVMVWDRKSNSATTTNLDGEFELLVPAQTESLAFNMIGYKQEVVTLNEVDGAMSIELEGDLLALDEVVVVGYGRRSLRSATRSVTGILEKEEVHQEIELLSALNKNTNDTLTIAKLALFYLENENISACNSKLESLLHLLKDAENLQLTQEAITEINNENNRRAGRNIRRLIRRME